MGCNKLIIAWFILAMLFHQEIQLVKGRQLRLGKTKDFQKFHSHQKTKETTKNHINIHDDRPKRETNVNELQHTAPVQVSDESQSIPGSPPSPGQLDGFRPTAPGRSPGAGHSFHN